MTASIAAAGAVHREARPESRRLDVVCAYFFTIVRFPLTAAIILTFQRDLPIAIAASAACVIADNVDGRFGARAGRDLPLREALDGITDRICVYSVLLAACLAYRPILLIAVGLVGTRDLVTGCYNARLARRRSIPKAGPIHALGSIGHIAFALSILATHGGPVAFVIGTLNVALTFALAVDYHAKLRSVTSDRDQLAEFKIVQL